MRGRRKERVEKDRGQKEQQRQFHSQAETKTDIAVIHFQLL